MGDKRDAVILDFFAGSGTTLQSTAMLNAADGGHRQCILVTNNDVPENQRALLAAAGEQPGSDAWEARGIAYSVTIPRVRAAVEGVRPGGQPVEGEYLDGTPVRDGFDENVEFFDLTYHDAATIELDAQFNAIAPLLWLRAGGVGPILTEERDGRGRKPFAWTDRYGVLFNPDRWAGFVGKLPATATTAFMVTDSRQPPSPGCGPSCRTTSTSCGSTSGTCRRSRSTPGRSRAMEYELFDYQRTAAVDCLDRMRKARRNWRDDGDRSAFALSAVTGAGKTVIATAVIEALLCGSTDLDVQADERACFLWVTEDPALNRQTEAKMLAASDLLTFAHFGEALDATFRNATLQRGRIYFLNIQQLGAKAGFGSGGGDKKPLSGWQIIGNTIRDPDTDLYVVLDEAHRGMTSSATRPTIVRRIIDGNGQNPPAPIVWGISATIERFTAAMGDAKHHTMLKPDVQVDLDAIRIAGIIKDRIELDQPDEPGDFHQTLLRAAVDDLRDFERRWRAYHESDGVPLVEPVLVVQIADKADKQVPDYVAVIEDQWGEPLDPRAVVNVFGEHTDITTPSGRVVRYMQPEAIQHRSDVRVVLAKTAISTGWDCPRAEVLISERPAKDATHIAQVIGRMVRSPLAHRVTGDDALNSVVCYLPLFDRDAVTKITEALTQPGEVGQATEITRRTQVFERNPRVPDEVFDFVAELPSWPKPDLVSEPLPRARLLAALLVDDRQGPPILPGAGEQLTAVLNARLDGLAAENKTAVAAHVANLETAEVHRTTAGTDGTQTSAGRRTIATALADLDRQTTKIVKATKEGFGADYRRYRYLAEQDAGTGKDELEVRTEIAALLMVDGITEQIQYRADQWTTDQLAGHVATLKLLTGTAAEEYLRVKEMAATQEQTTIVLPRNVKAPLDKIVRHKGAEDQVVTLPTWPGHLYADADDRFPFDAGGWERQVLEIETARDTIVAWYRNPSAAGVSSLRIGHQDPSAAWESVQVDFVVIERRPNGSLAASIVDPHGDHLSDAVGKLKALADYASRFGDRFARISAIAEGSANHLRVLELTDPAVRAAVAAWGQPKATALYDDHSLSQPYA